MSLSYNQFLRDFRLKNNLTQSELAKLLDVSVVAVSFWERGINPVSRVVYYSLLYLHLTQGFSL